MAGANFDVGDEVEVAIIDQSQRRMMLPAIIVAKGKSFTVEYKSVKTSSSGSRSSGTKRKNNNEPLREEVDATVLRPPVPPEDMDGNSSFQFGDKVDVLVGEGWRYGVVVEVMRRSKFGVHFEFASERVVVKLSEMRPHREWVFGAWVPPPHQLLLEQVGPKILSLLLLHGSEIVRVFSCLSMSKKTIKLVTDVCMSVF